MVQMVENGPNGRKWSKWLKMVKNGGPDLKQAQRTGLSARRARRTKSRGPKGLQIEVGARRAPRLLVYYIIHSTNKDGKDQKQGSKINLWTHGPTNCSIYKNSPAREGGVKLKHNLNQSFKQFPQNCLFGTVLAPYSIH